MLDKVEHWLMLDKVEDWIVQREFKKQAKRIVNNVSKDYSNIKAKNPDASEMEIIRAIVFDSEDLAEMPESSNKFIETCCQTIQGLCYLFALWPDMVHGLMGWRSQKMAIYIDKELEARGFPPQSEEQKDRILDAMNKYKFPSE